jgi:predicted permease
MPPRFAWLGAEGWFPDKPSETAVPEGQAAEYREKYWLLMGHMKAGASVKEACADLTVVAQRLATVYPKSYPKHFTVKVMPDMDWILGSFKTTLLVVLAAVIVLLLIGCGNVANLLLARATTRQKEMALRATLGAGRGRLIRQLLVESLLLAAGGATAGTLIAWGTLKSLVALLPPGTIVAEAEVRLNVRVLLFTLGVTILTALIFGLVPALNSARRDINESLMDSGKGSSGGERHGRIRGGLVVLEVALSLTLLVAAGLLMRSFVALREVQLGFRSDHVLVAEIETPEGRYKTGQQLAGFYTPLLERLKALPGVLDATATSELPPYAGLRAGIEISGRTHTEKWITDVNLSSEGYWRVLRIPFLHGRAFTEAEVKGARELAVVNEAFAKKYLGDEDPMGRAVTIPDLEKFPDAVKTPTFEIIGIVADAKNQGLQDPVMPEIWIPYSVTGFGNLGIMVRTTTPPATMLNAVQREISATDPMAVIRRDPNNSPEFTGTLEGIINWNSYMGPRFAFLMMTIFGSIGFVLVTIGVFSVLAYTTARRTHEIGIRMALGANVSDVVGMIIFMGLRLVGIGVVLGLFASLVLGKIIGSQLWGVSAYDPWTLVCVPIALLIVAMVACWIPARRAARVDPMIALRYE